MKTFEITDEQEKIINDWFGRHRCIGTRDSQSLVYEFSNTGIGLSVYIRCSLCEAAIDVSEYEKW